MAPFTSSPRRTSLPRSHRGLVSTPTSLTAPAICPSPTLSTQMHARPFIFCNYLNLEVNKPPTYDNTYHPNRAFHRIVHRHTRSWFRILSRGPNRKLDRNRRRRRLEQRSQLGHRRSRRRN